MPVSSSDSGPTPPSPRSSAPDGAAPVRGTALPLALAVAAGASCWNLFGAPFAVVTAVAALALALRVRAPPGAARNRSRLALALAGIALATAALVLWNGVRGVGPGAPVGGSPAPTAAEAEAVLDEAERQSAERREAARRELEGQGTAPDPRPRSLR